jgi:hypothetical protein
MVSRARRLNLIRWICLLFFCSGCTGHLSLQNRGCSDNTDFKIYEKPTRNPAKVVRDGSKFTVTKKVYTGSKFLSSPEKFKVSEILLEHGIRCNEVKNLSISTKSTGWDNFVGLIPFVSGKTIIIEGELTESVKEDDAIKEESSGEPSS